MEDSDDEVFWGPVTVRELQIISHQLFPTDEPKNTETETNSKLAPSQKLNNKEETLNGFESEDRLQSDIFDDKGDAKETGNAEHDLQNEDKLSANFSCTVPHIVISDHFKLEQDSSITIASATINEHNISDIATDDGYGSVVESLIHENVPVSQSNDGAPQSFTNTCESVKSLSNLEVNLYQCVASEDIVPSPEDRHGCLNVESNKFSRSDSDEVVIEHDSSNVNISVDGTCNSTRYNLSNLQKTYETHENTDCSKSVFGSISSSSSLTIDCSVDTHFSKSVDSFLLNDYDSVPFKFTTVSLNCTESQSQAGGNGGGYNDNNNEGNDNYNEDAVCERGASKNGQALSSYTNCEDFSDGHDSILSNFISETDPQSVLEKSHSNVSTCLLEEKSELSSKVNRLSPVFKNVINDKTSDICNINIDNITVTNDKCNSTPLRNGACTSKIPVLQKSPAFSESFKKRGGNSKSNSRACCEDSCGYFPSSHPFLIPVSPVSYDVNTDNLVTRSPNGNIIPTACSGSTVQTSTSISANYVHVMTSEKISELARNGFFMKPSPCAKEVSTADGRQSSASEDGDTFDIDAENSSVLCSSVFNCSSSGNNCSSSGNDSLNCTLEEMEMMMKHGYDYMCSKDDLNLKQELKEELQSNTLPSSVPKSEPEQKATQRGLKQYQYIRTPHEKIKPPTFHKEFTDVCADVAKTPVLNKYTQKAASAVCPRQLQQLKKTMNFSNIRSPVGAYIKDRPVPLLKTAGKVKPCGRDDIPSMMFEKEFVGSSAKQMPLKNVPTLPEIVYEKAPGINVNLPRAAEKCGSSKKLYSTPTIIKHAGRAVLATVPQNALQKIKNTEISVLYDKDASKTATL